MEMLLTELGFRALWTPELIIALVGVAFIYSWFFRRTNAGPKRKPLFFFLGLAALYLGWGSPLYVTGHVMMTLHMLQMVFAYFIAVPLLLLGIPQAWYEAVRSKLAFKPLRLVWNPICALLLFNGLFSFYHVPAMFDMLMQSPVLHSLYEWVLLFTAALMWWFILSPLPSSYKLPDLRRIFYIFANGLLITPACALIIFAPSAMYATYTDPLVWANVMAYCLPGGAGPELMLSAFGSPESLSIFEARIDQQLAGVLMKIFQEIVYGIAIGYVFKQWLKKEKLQDGELTISDVPHS
ncbi:cytochrome c oxidase assembly factor CtaG [Shouchella clausii]|uniref:Cytochrome c oxidase assembly factor CtaG n=2 Tax=Shouchella TaxID=2893057 RepID=A0A268P1A9_SHOCL|nr:MULTISPECIES: cytochrome c oxidase assembly factor CtaG [Shouchella]MCM3313289.1 cytochrome c oxidase assembly factor CtaG [Psychrobacillus sp. MER TA 17]ALA54524.1 CtaG protein [Shouchella clausii]MBU3232369.1 cytochrome c oxidase assembly factor CtaG [Shouchella clausii]MBU3263404.1 cytochrome c oxidase assembly factor CtaG [Shouchella clausii]MBU3505869.1 cytochrome c oxidase assembly factor CtaG [Shouchella clausii]